MDSRQVLKQESTGFARGLDIGYEGMKGTRNKHYISCSYAGDFLHMILINALKQPVWKAGRPSSLYADTEMERAETSQGLHSL